MYNEFLKRCKEQNIDIENCHIYMSNNLFDGIQCLKPTLSQDGKWLCIPIREYDNCFEDYTYIPHCFEIKEKLQTYLSSDSMWRLIDIYILYKEV